MTDETEIYNATNEEEELRLYYEQQKEPRADDAAAVQAVVCIIIIISVIGVNIFLPDLGEALIRLIKELSSRQGFISDPLGILLKKWNG